MPFFFESKIQKMKERITIQEIVAMNNTPKAKALIVKYGYSPAKNYDDLIYKLFRFTKEYQQEALEELSQIHPHKDLILNYNCKPSVPVKESKSNFHGDSTYCSCPHCRLKRLEMEHYPIYSNAEGNAMNNQKNSGIMEYLPAIAMISVVSAVLIVAMKNA